MRRTLEVLTVDKRSSVGGRYAEDPEPVRAHAHTSQELGIRTVANEIHGRPAVHREALDGTTSRPEIIQLRGSSGIGRTVVNEVHAHDASWLEEWQRLEQRGVHDAEDRRVRADAQRERQRDRDRESRCRAEFSQRIDDILTQISHELRPLVGHFRRAVDGVEIAPGIIEVPELSHRLGSRGLGRHP